MIATEYIESDQLIIVRLCSPGIYFCKRTAHPNVKQLDTLETANLQLTTIIATVLSQSVSKDFQSAARPLPIL